MPEHETKKKDVTFKVGLPMGRNATFTHEKELWIAVPASKYSAILGVTDHLIAIHHKIAKDMVRWMNHFPEDAVRAGKILKRVNVAFETHRELVQDKTKARVS